MANRGRSPRPERQERSEQDQRRADGGLVAPRAEVLMRLAALPVQDLHAYLRTMADTITHALSVDATGVFILDEARDALVPLATGDGAPPLREPAAGEPAVVWGRVCAALPLADQSALTEVFRTGAPYLAADARDDPTLPGAFAAAGIRALLAVPLVVDSARRGLLYVASRQHGAFGAEDQALLAVVAARVGLLMENAALAARRAALERAQAHAEARQEFLGLVSHELKTPIAVIKAYAEALQQRAARAGDGEGARILTRIEEQAARMLGLIEDLLDLQRLQGGLLTLEVGQVDLAALAARVAEELQATTMAHRLRVQADAPVVARVDRRRIEEVLINLLENAIKYSPAGGEITLTVRRTPGAAETGEQAVVAVSDQGIGIAPADLPRVFERFYQAEGGRLHRGVRGLGVGLYIAREIVERHGGALWVESVAGEGSTFYLTLPAGEG